MRPSQKRCTRPGNQPGEMSLAIPLPRRLDSPRLHANGEEWQRSRSVLGNGTTSSPRPCAKPRVPNPNPWLSYPRARESTPNDATPGETSLQPESHGEVAALLGNLALHTLVSISDPLLLQAVVLRERNNRFVRFFFGGNEGARTGSEVHSFSCCHTPDLPCRKDD